MRIGAHLTARISGGPPQPLSRVTSVPNYDLVMNREGEILFGDVVNWKITTPTLSSLAALTWRHDSAEARANLKAGSPNVLRVESPVARRVGNPPGRTRFEIASPKAHIIRFVAERHL